MEVSHLYRVLGHGAQSSTLWVWYGRLQVLIGSRRRDRVDFHYTSGLLIARPLSLLLAVEVIGFRAMLQEEI